MRRQRNTRQRQVILEELRAVSSHPTAAELYELVRRRLPRISMGTIYRNLDLLAKGGLVNRLEGDGAQARFDGDLEPHCHVRCVHCGVIGDIHNVPDTIPLDEISGWTDFEILGQRLDFIGVCPDCKGRDASAEN